MDEDSEKKMCEIREGNLLTHLLSCPHLLNGRSESSAAAPAANPTRWMDRINWSWCCQRSRQMRVADAPPVLTANCSIPVWFRIHVSRGRKARRMGKIKSIEIEVILAQRREKQKQPATLKSWSWSRFVLLLWWMQIFQVVPNVFCPQVAKKLVAPLGSSPSDFLQISHQCWHFPVLS